MYDEMAEGSGWKNPHSAIVNMVLFNDRHSFKSLLQHARRGATKREMTKHLRLIATYTEGMEHHKDDLRWADWGEIAEFWLERAKEEDGIEEEKGETGVHKEGAPD